ncbi:MAG: hypothetical protein HZB68_04305 [Candidatus Aenigmarchaeota archaeon]|nr:hypothetical protein [Candidatus Aenigmarchaeota archaeon]
MSMDFARVLVVAALMIGLLYFVTVPQTGFINIGPGSGSTGGGGGSQWLPAGREKILQPSAGTGSTLITDSDFFVGTRYRETFKDIPLPRGGISMSGGQKLPLLASIANAEAKNGLFSYQKQRLAFQIDEDQRKNVKGAVLNFEVLDTNGLGELIISYNGIVVYSGYMTKGQQSIELDSSRLSKENVVDIESASSGWRVWAPSVYTINAEVRSSLVSGEYKDTRFNLTGTESSEYRLTRLVFATRQGERGNMTVKMNGKQVFRGMLPSGGLLDIDEKAVSGENVIAVAPIDEKESSVVLERIIIFFNSRGTQTIEKAIPVTQADRNKLPGAITFDIKSIVGTPSSLSMTLVDADSNQKQFLITDILKQNKTIVIEVTDKDLLLGNNKAIISASGDGGFEITDFQVKY